MQYRKFALKHPTNSETNARVHIPRTEGVHIPQKDTQNSSEGRAEPGEWPPDIKSREPKSGRDQPTQASRPRHTIRFSGALCDVRIGCKARIRRKALQWSGPQHGSKAAASDAQNKGEDADKAGLSKRQGAGIGLYHRSPATTIKYRV